MGILSDQLSIGFALGASARLGILPPKDQHEADKLKDALKQAADAMHAFGGKKPYKAKRGGGYERSSDEERALRRRMEIHSDRAFRSQQRYALARDAWESRYMQKRSIMEMASRRVRDATNKAESSYRAERVEGRFMQAYETERKVARAARVMRWAGRAAKIGRFAL